MVTKQCLLIHLAVVGFVKVAKRLCEEEGGLEVNMTQMLLHYHQNSFAMLECYKHISKTFNADQPLQDLITQGQSRWKHLCDPLSIPSLYKVLCQFLN